MAGRWEKGNYRRGAADSGDNVICWVMLLGVARLGSQKICAYRSVGVARDLACRRAAAEHLARRESRGDVHPLVRFQLLPDNRTTFHSAYYIENNDALAESAEAHE